MNRLCTILKTGCVLGALACTLYAGDSVSTSIWNYSLEDLMGITVVTSSKYEENLRDAPSVMSIVTRSEIETYGARTLFDVLDRVAATYIYGSYFLPNNMVTIRGEATSHYCTHVLMMIDGRPFRSSKEGYLLPLIDGFPLEVIERIEIIRGPGSTLYGTTAYAGAINIITRQAAAQPTVATTSIGSLGTRQAGMATAVHNNDMALTFGSQYWSSDGWPFSVRDGTADSLYQPFEARAPRKAFGLLATARWKEAHCNTFFGSSFQNNGYQLQRVYDWPELNLGTSHALVDAGFRTRIGSLWTGAINLTYNFQHTWQPFDINAQDVREFSYHNDLIAEMTSHFQPVRQLHVTLGALTTFNSGHIINNQQRSDGSSYDVWSRPPNPDPFAVVEPYRELWFSGYINAAYAFPRFVKVVAGLHANKVPDLRVDVVPRVGVVGTFTDNITLKMLYGQAFRQGDVFERFSAIHSIMGNAALKPEKIGTFEAQLAWTNPWLRVTLGGFQSRQENLIDRANLPAVDTAADTPVRQRFVNVGTLDSRGVEMEGVMRLDDFWSINTSLCYHENYNQDGVSDLFGVPNILAKLGCSWRSPRLGAGVFASHYNYWRDVTGYHPVYPRANPAVRPYTYVTLHAIAHWSRILRIPQPAPAVATEIFIVNLLNEKIHYPEIGRRFVNSIPGRPGTTLYATLRVEL